MGFSRQDYWSGLPFPSPGDLPMSPVSPALAGGFFTTEPPGKHYLAKIVGKNNNLPTWEKWIHIKVKQGQQALTLWSWASRCLFLSGGMACGIWWDLRSPTMGWINSTAVRAPSPKHWTTRETPGSFSWSLFCLPLNFVPGVILWLRSLASIANSALSHSLVHISPGSVILFFFVDLNIFLLIKLQTN